MPAPAKNAYKARCTSPRPGLFARVPLARLARILRKPGAKRLWLTSRAAGPHVLMPLPEYADLLAYKRQALSWAELSADEQAIIAELAKSTAQDRTDG